MTRDTPQKDSGIDQLNDSRDDRHVCRMTGREQGLVGKYDIWLCRQSFRELAPKMGFKKYD
ncbi:MULTISPECIES: 30S ribosomal protein S14 [Halorubrum]|uniref:Ribosomal protein S14.2 n=1 Tax=Halorubrum kocurii JCM 14978 TaxID=1230456 RepID=M0PKG1_9EURY|nr:MULTISPECIES: 30S ribosomal protein S14 [Halorubrum]EMA69250.1 ribosomal protein S14.2 [Halorubrum kocurii JCM 14978]MDV7350984.1 30S ribosomal protein S14 [Halorubrum distributum]